MVLTWLDALGQIVWYPNEDQLPIIPGDGLPRKFLPEAGNLPYHAGWKGHKVVEIREAFDIDYNEDFGGQYRSLLESGFESPPEAKHQREAVYYSPFEKVGGIGGYEYLPAPPDMGSGQYAGTWGMQGGLVILMFGVCYMLYMLLKKRVCSFSIGWKDTDGGELELGGPRNA